MPRLEHNMVLANPAARLMSKDGMLARVPGHVDRARRPLFVQPVAGSSAIQRRVLRASLRPHLQIVADTNIRRSRRCPVASRQTFPADPCAAAAVVDLLKRGRREARSCGGCFGGALRLDTMLLKALRARRALFLQVGRRIERDSALRAPRFSASSSSNRRRREHQARPSMPGGKPPDIPADACATAAGVDLLKRRRREAQRTQSGCARVGAQRFNWRR
jgi:hypothetical protein